MKKRLISFIAAAMAIALTGCSNQSASDASAPAAEESQATDAAKDSSSKKWIITTDTVFRPFEYTDDSGNFVGIDVDLIEAIAQDQGFDYELQSLGWDASIATCQAGQADGMMAGASITEERKASGWIFSDGYYDANQSIAVKSDSDINGFEDLSGKNVAVKTGTMSASYAEELAINYNFTVTYFEDSPSMYQAVADDKVSGCFDDTPIMANTIKDSGIPIRILENTGNDPASYGFVIFKAENQPLMDMFNAGLSNIKANGKYDEIIKKYLGN